MDLWVGAVPNCGWGSHIIRQENTILKFVLQDLIFMDSGTKEKMMVQGGLCVLCSEVGAGDCSGYLRTAPPQVHLLHSGDPKGTHQE